MFDLVLFRLSYKKNEMEGN